MIKYDKLQQFIWGTMKKTLYLFFLVFLMNPVSAYTINSLEEKRFNHFELNITFDSIAERNNIWNRINSEKSQNIVNIDYIQKESSLTYIVYGSLRDYSIPKNKLFNPWFNTSYELKEVYNITNGYRGRIINITTTINRSDVFVNESDLTLLAFYNLTTRTDYVYVNLSAGSGSGNYNIAKYINQSNSFSYSGNLSNISIADNFDDSDSRLEPKWNNLTVSGQTNGQFTAGSRYMISTTGTNTYTVTGTNFTNTTLLNSINQSGIELNYTFNIGSNNALNYQILITNNTNTGMYTAGCSVGMFYYEVRLHLGTIVECKSGVTTNLITGFTTTANTLYYASLRLNNTGIRYIQGSNTFAEAITTNGFRGFNQIQIFSYDNGAGTAKTFDNITLINYTEPAPSYNLSSIETQYHQLYGYIFTGYSANIIGALIEFNNTQTISDLGGYYEFNNILPDNYTVKVHMVGYENKSTTIYIPNNTGLNITLTEKDTITTDDAVSYGFAGAMISGMLFFALIKRRRGSKNEI